MKRVVAFLALTALTALIVGCRTADPDPDPRLPLMDTNSFTNFIPIEMSTNSVMTNITNEAGG
jgi:hypothetical protein